MSLKNMIHKLLAWWQSQFFGMLADRRTIGAIRRTMAEFCGFQPMESAHLSARQLHLDRACAKWHAPRALAYLRSVNAIRHSRRFAPLGYAPLTPCNPCQSHPCQPPAPIPDPIGALSARIGATRSFQFPGNGVTGACRASSPTTQDPAL